ncbi:unnamed protein product, partial [Hapterophycus canaliculatus]
DGCRRQTKSSRGSSPTSAAANTATTLPSASPLGVAPPPTIKGEVVGTAGNGGGRGNIAEGKQAVDDEIRQARAKAMVPMRPEEYAAQQRTLREVFDEDTGRWRLVKGTGEIMERIVSRQEQQEIQQHASR